MKPFTIEWCEKELHTLTLWKEVLESTIKRVKEIKEGAKPTAYEQALFDPPDPQGIWSSSLVHPRMPITVKNDE